MKTFIERIRWWIYFPRFELIYLLGGIPKEHIGVTHYRNIVSIMESIKANINKANQ